MSYVAAHDNRAGDVCFLLLCGQVQHQLLELQVLECSPVTQGTITADTSLVLTDCWDLMDPPAAPLVGRQLSLCVSDFAHYADGLVGRQSLLGNRRLISSGLSGVLQALECRLDVQVVDTQNWHMVRGQQGAAVDMDSCVFVSKRLLLRLGLFNQEWVRLSRPGGSSRGPTGETDSRGGACRERPVFVVVVDLTLSPELQNQEDIGYISATLWFNLTEGDVIPLNSCTLRMKVQHRIFNHTNNQKHSAQLDTTIGFVILLGLYLFTACFVSEVESAPSRTRQLSF